MTKLWIFFFSFSLVAKAIESQWQLNEIDLLFLIGTLQNILMDYPMNFICALCMGIDMEVTGISSECSIVFKDINCLILDKSGS